MIKTFRMVTDELFGKLGAEELANELACSLGSVKQARMDPGSPSYREPPPGWEKAAIKLIDRRIAQLARLKASLIHD